LYVSAVFAIHTHNAVHKRWARFMLQMMTCRDFARFERYAMWQSDGIKTTCLSSMPSLSSHRTIYQLHKRDRFDANSYRLAHRTAWHELTFQEALELWLKKDEKQSD